MSQTIMETKLTRLCECGVPVRLGGHRVRVNRRQGVWHYIAHAWGRGADCQWLLNGDWHSLAIKPYPKIEADKAYIQLIERWNSRPKTTEPQPRPGSEGQGET